MELTAENLAAFFPYYLTEERKRGLLAALRDIPSRRYFASINDPEPLQGDGWRGLEILRFSDGTRDRIKGLVLTNSCDLAGGSKRVTPSQLNFVPLVAMKNYLGLLAASAVSEERIAQHSQDVRAQLITDLFYLPPDQTLAEEHIAVLSDVHTIPMAAFDKDTSKARLFSLSDVGFYLFVFKLSVHFCRLHESIDRSPVA